MLCSFLKATLRSGQGEFLLHLHLNDYFNHDESNKIRIFSLQHIPYPVKVEVPVPRPYEVIKKVSRAVVWRKYF